MDDVVIYEEILRLKRARRPSVLATIVESAGSTPRKAGTKMLILDDGTLVGTIGGGVTEAKVAELAREVLRSGKPRTVTFALTEQEGAVCGGQLQLFLEPLAAPPRLLIVGDGHVGRAVAECAGFAGFHVVIVDPEEASMELPMDDVDEETCVFIAARDHETDFWAAIQALATPARYIGLLGSRRKRVVLEERLLAAGFPPGAAERVTSPAGLAIGAQTPREIAVSVVAQLIQHRRGGAQGVGDSIGRRAFDPDGVPEGPSAFGR